MYNNDSYILLNQTLILCSNFTRNYTRIRTRIVLHQSTQSSIRVLRIITYVGFSLSIIALLFLLVTYFLFAELRTYPGKKVMHLSCALIAMQSVYFATDPDVVSSAVCAVMGAFLHYFILAAFLWMSVIAHNVRETFSNLTVDLNNPLVIAKRRKSYIRYSFFSWGFPLVVVGICVTLQLTNTGNVGYGNEDGCQLSLPARTFAVAVPVSSMVLFNIVAVIRTAVANKTARTDQYRGFESEKPTLDCTETDSCHGDHMDPGICVGFLSNSIFGISIHHNQQLSRCADLPLVCVQEECLHSVQTKIHDVNTPTTYKYKRKLAADGV
ncbi:hypothetical protein OS493_003612 [Desmophyllum pertusum]|uniref:G-protein coupled receptors family 2 profile 2 domain-containing protein n=1 Tax=Desmophyllum pertusum TaxID=174260 RepID=A0A9X0DCQ2_9CNID|nr:hypothetical protein OS493_003612 [Desmophyllum pertusum]